MRVPTTLDELKTIHIHEFEKMSPEERASLSPVEWIAPMAPEYLHLQSVNVEGTWPIGHPCEDGTAELHYQLPIDDHEYKVVMNRRSFLDSSEYEWWKHGSTLSPQVLGKFFNQDYARKFVDLARYSNTNAGEPADLLLAASFEETYPHDDVRVFKKCDENGGTFAVFVGPTQIKSTYSKKNSTAWVNLMNLNIAKKSMGGTIFIPSFWSPEITNPLLAATEMAVVFSNEWRPVIKNKSVKKKTLSP